MEKKIKKFAIVIDYGFRTHQDSFGGEEEVFRNYDRSKFSKMDWTVENDLTNHDAIRNECEAKGWSVCTVRCCA